MMEDESGMDEKILAVPTSKLDVTFDGVQDINDVPEMLKNKIKHFFEHYKELEKGKWVKIVGWKDTATARTTIEEAIDRVK